MRRVPRLGECCEAARSQLHVAETPCDISRHGQTSKVNLADKLARIDEHWKPKIVADLNDYELKLVEALGEFTWHAHEDTVRSCSW